jgi:hypothetical protein
MGRQTQTDKPNDIKIGTRSDRQMDRNTYIRTTITNAARQIDTQRGKEKQKGERIVTQLKETFKVDFCRFKCK